MGLSHELYPLLRLIHPWHSAIQRARMESHQWNRISGEAAGFLDVTVSAPKLVTNTEQTPLAILLPKRRRTEGDVYLKRRLKLPKVPFIAFKDQ